MTDALIKAMAKQQRRNNPSLLIKDQTLNQQLSPNQTRSKKVWQWSFSLVACVGLLGVLLTT